MLRDRSATTIRNVADKMWAVVRTFMSSGSPLRPICDGSDSPGASLSLHEYVWFTVNSTEDAWSEGCGKAVPIGDPIYEVVVDSREMRLGPACGRQHMERRYNGRAKKPNKMIRRVEAL